MKAEVKDNKLYYREFLIKKELPIEDIRWVYLQKEDVNSKLCCGSLNIEITRVIVVDKNGKKISIEYESNGLARECESAKSGLARECESAKSGPARECTSGKREPARELMNAISEAGSHILVGYTDENIAIMG